jgi:hypothetical protein
MKKPAKTRAVTIRYMGNGVARTFLIERGDKKYWTGRNWTKNIDKAKMYPDHKSAQKACVAFQHEKYQGMPLRTFKVETEIKLVGDEIENLSEEALARFIAEAVRIDIENVIYGDGPLDNSFVQARMLLATLSETESPRDTF